MAVGRAQSLPEPHFWLMPGGDKSDLLGVLANTVELELGFSSLPFFLPVRFSMPLILLERGDT